jgi:hypothetical protein
MKLANVVGTAQKFLKEGTLPGEQFSFIEKKSRKEIQ